jgi:tRNA dimethylallyltransferase
MAEYHNYMNLQPNLQRSALICAIVGPTASGKSRLAMSLATKLHCPIVCVDSMQVYRGLNIGTAKPTWEDQKTVPHFGLDLANPTERFSSDRYTKLVEPVIEEAKNNQSHVILCGGTGFYFRALLEGFVETPDPDMELRNRLYSQIEQKGNETLYEELKNIDPQTAATIHANDTKRVIRALEIFYQTGQSLSTLKENQPKKDWLQHTKFIGLKWQPDDLRKRIKERTLWMFETGLIDETQWMLHEGCKPGDTAMQALGYKECAEYLNGAFTLDEAISATIQNTAQYAKRQRTWFRHQFPVHWLDCTENSAEKELQEQCLQIW